MWHDWLSKREKPQCQHDAIYFGEKGVLESLPDDLMCYYDLIEDCPYLVEERGKVGYLIVHESFGLCGGFTALSRVAH